MTGYTPSARAMYASGHSWNGSVYYFRWPTVPFLVKIGWSRDVRNRLLAFAWDGRTPELLAAEPSPDGKLEFERHQRFSHLQVTPTNGPEEGRTEVFLRTDELNDWMARLRDHHRGWPWQTSLRGQRAVRAVMR